MTLADTAGESRLLITTVIPTFRRPHLLRRAIQSVVKQELDVRVLVCDNASGDETSAVVAELSAADPRIQYHCHERNIGAIANINYGIGLVRTRWFSVLSDDDALLPGFYQMALDAFTEHPDAACACGRTAVVNDLAGTRTQRSQSWPRGLHQPSIDAAIHMVRDHFISTGVVFRSDVLATVGQFDEFGSDRNYMVRLAALHPFFVSHREVAEMRIHGESFSGGRRRAVRFTENAVHSLGADYIVGTFHALLTDILAMPSLSAAEKDRFRSSYLAYGRRQLKVWCLLNSVAENRPAEILRIVTALEALGEGRASRSLLAATARVMGSSELAGRLVSGATSLAVRARESLRRR